jgi:hypothetical protein
MPGQIWPGIFQLTVAYYVAGKILLQRDFDPGLKETKFNVHPD